MKLIFLWWCLLFNYLKIIIIVVMIFCLQVLNIVFLNFYWSMIIPLLLLQKLTNMILYTFKTFSSCYVIHCYATMSISKICLWYWPKPFLSSCIPNLNLYDFLVYFQCFYLEVYSDCTWSCAKNFICKAE